MFVRLFSQLSHLLSLPRGDRIHSSPVAHRVGTFDTYTAKIRIRAIQTLGVEIFASGLAV